MRKEQIEKEKAEFAVCHIPSVARPVHTCTVPDAASSRRLVNSHHWRVGVIATMRWLPRMQGYTNNDNPFGDVRLEQKFVWGKVRCWCRFARTSRLVQLP